MEQAPWACVLPVCIACDAIRPALHCRAGIAIHRRDGPADIANVAALASIRFDLQVIEVGQGVIYGYDDLVVALVPLNLDLHVISFALQYHVERNQVVPLAALELDL